MSDPSGIVAVMVYGIAGDVRLDPGVRAFLIDDEVGPADNVDSREALLAEAAAETEAGANPLAWPSFATEADVEGFPPVVITVHECDPRRDEGVNFCRLLPSAGVPARCRQIMGAMHAAETFTTVCPDISRDTARDLAAFCRG